jgi:hypothetical protein
MAIKISSQIELPPVRTAPPWRRYTEPEAPPTQTKPQREDADGWFTRVKKRVKLAMQGDDEELLIGNTTAISWHIYHKYHLLGIIDPGETRLFRLRKTGNLNARPSLESDESEYLIVDLNAHIQRVQIYRRQMGQAVEIYDMRAA